MNYIIKVTKVTGPRSFIPFWHSLYSVSFIDGANQDSNLTVDHIKKSNVAAALRQVIDTANAKM